MKKRLPDIAVQAVLIRVSGAIQEIHEPKALENFTGYARVLLNGRLVAGQFPFLDFNFQYNFSCRSEKYEEGAIYRIVSACEPPFVPLPLTALRLKQIFIAELGMGDQQATDLVLELRQHPLLGEMNFDNLSPMKLLTTLLPTPDWLNLLAENSMYFRYPFLELLTKFWPYAELKHLSVTQLLELGSSFDRDPEQFCYSWRNGAHLPELKWEAVSRAFTLLGREPDAGLRSRLVVYNNLTTVRKRTGALATDMQTLKSWSIDYRSAVGRKVIKLVLEHNSPELRVFIFKDWQDVQYICGRLGQLFAHFPRRSLWLKRRPKQYATLTATQKEIFDACQNLPVLFLNGGGGVGKSYLGKALYEMSQKKMTRATAYFGRVASLLKKHWGRGITIHRMAMLVQRRTAEGTEILNNTRRLFIDEGSHLTVEVLAMALEACPALEQLVIIGDEAQMRPPSPGPVYESLIEYYSGSPLVRRLTEIMRVDRADAEWAHTMIENSQKIRDGRTDLVFSRELDGAPLVVLSRQPIPPTMRGRDQQQARIMIMKNSLAPIVRKWKDPSEYQILARTHDVIYDLNCALSLLYDEIQPTYGGMRIFRPGSKIMFTQNYYPQELSVPKKPAERAAFFKRPEWYLRTSQINRGEVDVVESIVDVNPLTGTETAVANTTVDKAAPTLQRILRLASGNQVNLITIPLGKISRGDASTIASSQGSAYRKPILYIDEGDVEPKGSYGPMLKCNDFYTVATRAEKELVVICKAPYNSLENSDIGRIINAHRAPPDNLIFQWLPPYVQPVEAANEENPEHSQSGDDDEDEDGDYE